MGFGDFLTKAKDTAVGGFNAIADGASALHDYVADSAPVKMATEALTTAKDKVTSVVKDGMALVSNIVPSVIADNIPSVSITTAVGSFIPDTLKFAAKTVVQNLDTIALAALNPIAGMGYALAKSGTWKSDDGKLTVTKLEGKGLGAGQTGDSVWTALAHYVGAGTAAATPADSTADSTATAKPDDDEEGCLEFTNVYDETTGQPVKACGLPTEREQKVVLTEDEWDYLNGDFDASPETAQPTDAPATEEVQRTANEGDPAQSHNYTDAAGQSVAVQAGDGKVNITKTDADGKVISQVQTFDGGSTATTNGEQAARNVTDNISTVTSPEGTMRQEGDVRIIEKGEFIIKEEGGKINWYDKKTGKLIRELTREGVTSQVNDQVKVQVLAPSTEVQAAARKMQDDMAQAPDDALGLIVAEDMTIAITNRLRVEALKNGNCIFRARQPNGDEKVFLMDAAGKLLALVDGKFVDADDAAKEAWQLFKKQLEQMPGAAIDTATGRVTVQGLTIEGNHVTYGGNQPSEKVDVTRDDTGKPTVVEASGVTTTIEGEKVVIEDPTFGKTTWAADTSTLELPGYVMTPDKMENTVTGTSINRAGDIEMDHGNGPTLRADGSVKFDDQTEVDAHGNVRSGAWHASAGYASGADASAAPGGSLEKSTQAKIGSATADANAVKGKANNRKVSMSDIGSVESALTSISVLVGVFATAGNGAMLSLLAQAIGQLNETRSAAINAFAVQQANEQMEQALAAVKPAVSLTIARAA